MSNRGYSSTASYGGNNYYMRPTYPSSMYDQDRYYGQGRPYGSYDRPTRPEYYDKNAGYGGYDGYGGNRGSSGYGYENYNFRPWDQTYR